MTNSASCAPGEAACGEFLPVSTETNERRCRASPHSRQLITPRWKHFRELGAQTHESVGTRRERRRGEQPLLSFLVSGALLRGGLERRGEIARAGNRLCVAAIGQRPLTWEFEGVSVMPRSMWEPGLCFANRLTGVFRTTCGTGALGGFRRVSNTKPFGDVIESAPTRALERKPAPHPSLEATGVPASTGTWCLAARARRSADPARGGGVDARCRRGRWLFGASASSETKPIATWGARPSPV